MHYFLFIYFNNEPLHVSSRLAACHQEDRLCINSKWYSVRGMFIRYVHWLGCCRQQLIFRLFWHNSPPVGHGLLIHEVSVPHTTTHHSRYDSSGLVISSSQRFLPDNTQHSQQTNIHDQGGIRTHNLSRRAAADLRLRPRGHWDRL